MTWPRQKLNYAFNAGDFHMFKDAKSLQEVTSYISEVSKSWNQENAIHEVLKIFLTSKSEEIVIETKKLLESIANEIYGESRLEAKRAIFFEAVETNIVFQEDLSKWDYEQWCLAECIEPAEEELF